MSDDKAALADFNGIARLFPLSNLVLCPHALQPLHIFEPRYRQMIADALADDRLIALVLLEPGWEGNADLPSIRPVGCLGRIVADQLLPDGRYNLLLRGLSRVRIIEEVATDKLYRSVRAALVADCCDAGLEIVMDLRKQLEERILPRFKDGPIAKQLTELFRSELTLGALCDVLSFALPISVESKQKILEEAKEDIRATMLLEGLDDMSGPSIAIAGNTNRKFPPNFSSN
jgi:uncharacterized protein